jgi:hypothetical protein
MHALTTGFVFHFPDGSFVRCIRGRGPIAEARLEEDDVLYISDDNDRRVTRHVPGRLALRNKRSAAFHVVWAGNMRRIVRVAGRRFPLVYHYFLPALETGLGLW